MASTLFTLAEKTGWKIDYMLWEIPISLINQAVHTYLYFNGAKLKRTQRINDNEFMEIVQKLGIDS